MTVKELIERLEKINAESKVYVVTYCPDWQDIAWFEVEQVSARPTRVSIFLGESFRQGKVK